MFDQAVKGSTSTLNDSLFVYSPSIYTHTQATVNIVDWCVFTSQRRIFCLNQDCGNCHSAQQCCPPGNQ